SDLGLETERMMKNERISSEWAEVEAYGEGSTYWGIGVLKRYVSEMYGASGKLRQVADRLLRAVEESKQETIASAAGEKDDQEAHHRALESGSGVVFEACWKLP